MMKVSVDRALLKKALATLGPLCKHRSKPVLECVRLQVLRGKLLVTATNLNTQVTITLACSEHETGVVLLEKSLLVPLLKNGVPQVSFEERKGFRVDFSNGHSRATLPGTDPDEYPKLWTRRARGYAHVIEALAFARLIDVSMPFAAEHPGRYAMNGICLTPGHEVKSQPKILAVGTDGRRLGFGSVPIAEEPEHVADPKPLPKLKEGEKAEKPKPSPVILERSAAALMRKLIPRTKKKKQPIFGPVRLWLPNRTDVFIAFEFDHALVISRRIDGDFPRYTEVVPDSLETRWICDNVQEVQDAIDAVKSACSKERRAVRLTLKGKAIIMSAKSEHAEATTSFPVTVVSVGGEQQREIGLNVDYLSDALAAVAGNSVQIGWNDKRGPVAIELGDDGARAVIMPISLDN